MVTQCVIQRQTSVSSTMCKWREHRYGCGHILGGEYYGSACTYCHSTPGARDRRSRILGSCGFKTLQTQIPHLEDCDSCKMARYLNSNAGPLAGVAGPAYGLGVGGNELAYEQTTIPSSVQQPVDPQLDQESAYPQPVQQQVYPQLDLEAAQQLVYSQLNQEPAYPQPAQQLVYPQLDQELVYPQTVQQPWDQQPEPQPHQLQNQPLESGACSRGYRNRQAQPPCSSPTPGPSQLREHRNPESASPRPDSSAPALYVQHDDFVAQAPAEVFVPRWLETRHFYKKRVGDNAPPGWNIDTLCEYYAEFWDSKGRWLSEVARETPTGRRHLDES